MKIVRITLFAVLAFNTGCGGDAVKNETQQAKSLDVLTGKWASCTFDGESGGSDVYEFDNGAWTYSSSIYEDQSCEIIKEGTTFTRTGTYTIGDEVTTSAGVKATELKMSQANGDVCYTIFEVTQDTLHFGLIIDFETECDTPENRPVDLDYEFSYHKVYD